MMRCGTWLFLLSECASECGTNCGVLRRKIDSDGINNLAEKCKLPHFIRFCRKLAAFRNRIAADSIPYSIRLSVRTAAFAANFFIKCRSVTKYCSNKLLFCLYGDFSTEMRRMRQYPSVEQNLNPPKS